MSTVSLPDYVDAVLARFNNRGIEAYVVGGCVRDILMGRVPNDYDICTSALPQMIMELFPDSLPTGIKHGTVTVRSEGHNVEITTFREDGEYSDSRHPDQVHFLSGVEGDLTRRDFTINAMAMDRYGRIKDLFGGENDIKAGIIRCVGDPAKRFSEDALRMFRAIRFSAQLGFDTDITVMEAVCKLSPAASTLSSERIRDEIEKTLLSPTPRLAGTYFEMGLMDRFSSRGYSDEFENLKRAPVNARQRWSALCAVLIRGAYISDSAEFLTRLRLDSKTVRAASGGAEIAVRGDISDSVGWKHCIAKNGVEASICAASSMDVVYGIGHRAALDETLTSGECMRISELALDGNDLLKYGLRGTEIGRAQNMLLEQVISHPEVNTKENLLKFLQSSHF